MTSMTNSLQMNLQRGDVVLCQVPMLSTGMTQFKIRPALVVSADRINQNLDDIIVAPCTSNTNRPLTETQYLITGDEIALAGLRIESVVSCETILALNKSMILRKLGSLPTEAINQVNRCLIVALEL
jgi:mRNA interferase MazF